MDKNIIIAIVASSILLIVGVIIWLVVSSRWPPAKIEKLRQFFRLQSWNDKEQECVIDYITSISFRRYNNMTDKQQLNLIESASKHCEVIYDPKALINHLGGQVVRSPLDEYPWES